MPVGLDYLPRKEIVVKTFLLACAGLILSVSVVAQEQKGSAPKSSDQDIPLGKLFFTPEQRNALDQQRRYKLKAIKTLEGETLRIDGVMLRSSGKKTYWVNGQAQHDNETPSGVAITSRRQTPGQATVMPSGEKETPLRVGETLNRATGEKQTGLGNGTLSIKSR
jgi:hypothetical protein